MVPSHRAVTGRDTHEVARAANARDATLFTNVMCGQRDAHQHDVRRRSEACQLCSSAVRYRTFMTYYCDGLVGKRHTLATLRTSGRYANMVQPLRIGNLDHEIEALLYF